MRLLILLLLCLPLTTRAQDGLPPGSEDEVDSPAIYEEFKASMAGEGPTEEIDAWWRYLATYPDTPYRIEIERRIEALEDAAYEEFIETTRKDAQKVRLPDAKDSEPPIGTNPMMDWNPNPRRHLEVGVGWGATDLVTYDVQFEWAFLRRVSAFGGLRHLGPSGIGIGGSIYAGAKAAIVKDMRTNFVLSGALAIAGGLNGLEGGKFEVLPWIGFGWAPNDRFQLQSSASMVLRLDKVRTAVLWNLMAVISPIKPLGIFIASRQKHGLYKPGSMSLQYLGFYDAGVGVTVRPTPLIDISAGATIPYFWRAWRDYRYVGVTVDAVFRLKSAPKG